MKRLFLPVLLSMLAAAFLPRSATAGEQNNPAPPQFTFWQEIWLQNVFKAFEGNKAYALGPGNLDWYGYEYETLDQARAEALNGCRAAVREAFGETYANQCQLVMENDKLVWNGTMPRPMTESFLPEPDLPLARANVFGDIDSAKGILLALHGCDGQADSANEWYKGWIDAFVSRGYAVISPSSQADPHEFLCGDDIADAVFDPVIRLRVAQTLRTLANLKKLYPGKPIVLWGNGEGGTIAQAIGFDVKGTVITVAACLPASPSVTQPLLHVFSSTDDFALPENESLPLTPKKVETACANYGGTGARRFVVVKSDDAWVPVSEPSVQKALEDFLSRLPD